MAIWCHEAASFHSMCLSLYIHQSIFNNSPFVCQLMVSPLDCQYSTTPRLTQTSHCWFQHYDAPPSQGSHMTADWMNTVTRPKSLRSSLFPRGRE